MKKRLLALVACMTLVLGMSVSAMAASPSASAAAETAKTETIVTTATGENITPAKLESYAATTTLASSTAADAKITPTTPAAAVSLVYHATKEVGSQAKVLSMVDVSASSAGTFTVNVPGVVAGQNVTAIHLISSEKAEVLPATAGNGTVTFSMTTYSPVAIVTKATSPATGNSTVVIILAAIAALTAAAFCARKYAK